MSAEKTELGPLYVFEISWEVCNKVGGIYTVLATKAAEMVRRYGDRYILIGPKIWSQDHYAAPEQFIPENPFPELVNAMAQAGVDVSCGRWDIPGKPRCILVDFSAAYKEKDRILESLWSNYQVDSLTGGWDYVEPVLFGHTAGSVIQHFANHYAMDAEIVAHWHEWMVGSGMLHLKLTAPEIASVFTTHATILGRSIASSGESLETALSSLDAPARAKALHIRAKYSLEHALIQEADCFTTVSTTTADEAHGIYGRRADVLLPNGLGAAFPNPAFMETDRVARVRRELFTLAETMTGEGIDPKRSKLVVTSGRYEYVNKGVNLLVDALALLESRQVGEPGDWVVFFLLPADHGGPDQTLLANLQAGRSSADPVVTTHVLADSGSDALLSHTAQVGLKNGADSRVRLIFAPVYLDGRDGVFNREYYELLPAFDLSIFPSHYEPWGYTPLESIGFGVPTVTSDLAGFGQWAAARSDLNETAVYVLPRGQRTYQQSVRLLAKHLVNWSESDDSSRQAAGREALILSQKARWEKFASFYEAAHRASLLARTKRLPGVAKRFASPKKPKSPQQQRLVVEGEHVGMMHWRPFTVKNRMPNALQGLESLAYNLWWSWSFPAEALFRDLDQRLWEATGHNPVKLLDTLPQAVLDAAAEDEAFLARYRDVMAAFQTYLDARRGSVNPEIAYFCMEYGIHECLALYSGGLGVLAGDHLKAASDLDLPLVAVGMAYHAGYFRQKFDISGNQIDEPMQLDFSAMPMRLLRREDGTPLQIKILFPGHKLHIGVWEVAVGSVRLFLLDTDLPQNTPHDRAITANLYGGDQEKRLRQEMVLGIGGRNLLAELELNPKVWHLNEGHASFLVLSRAAALMQQHNLDFQTAIAYCRETGVFTTHTPVPAGHDVFPEDLMRPYFSIYRHILHISWDRIMDLGRYPEDDQGKAFSMTVLGMRGSADVNGVSQLHGEVSQRNLQPIAPGYHWREVPVGAITNGVHLPTWLAPSLQTLLDQELTEGWHEADRYEDVWQQLATLDKGRFREIRTQLKRTLLGEIRQQIMGIWDRHQDDPGLLNAILGNLREDACIIGFARRFAPYKRATLLFRDLEVLGRMVSNPDRPVIFLFAGKAHPADEMGKALIKEIHQISRRPPFQGRIILLENYDMALAKHLVRGCDIWLNTPTRPLEASGTSGMKAAMNGVVNVSVLDGWWVEGYNGDNGWAIGEDRIYESAEYQDDYDSQHLYSLLEEQVLPRYFGHGEGPSDAWLDTALASMNSSLAAFAARRMVGQYRDNYYGPAAGRATTLVENQFQAAQDSAGLKRRLSQLWEHLRVLDFHVGGIQDGTIHHGDEVSLQVSLQHPKIAPSQIEVQMVVGLRDPDGDLRNLEIYPLSCDGTDDNGVSHWKGMYQPSRSGAKAFGLRVVPRLPLERHGVATDLALVHWVH